LNRNGRFGLSDSRFGLSDISDNKRIENWQRHPYHEEYYNAFFKHNYSFILDDYVL
jgi:hypothetical protein